MPRDLAAANVNRCYQLAASSIAIFTFLLFFLYPRFASREIEAWPFQGALMVMGVATFSFAFASWFYYGASLDTMVEDDERMKAGRRADRMWLLACMMLFLAPSLILFAVKLWALAAFWFALWLIYTFVVITNFHKIRTGPGS